MNSIREVSHRSNRRGLSLVEAIISIFLMVMGFLVMGQLYHSAMQYQAMVTERTVAATLAERQMERIRGWSAQVHKSPGGTASFDNASWASCPGAGATTTDPDNPGFNITVQTVAQALYSPCTQFETQPLQGAPRRINTAARRVDVLVRWQSNREFVLSSLVCLPTGEPKGAAPVGVGAIGSLAFDARRTTSANLTNADNRLIPDAFFTWEVASLAPSADPPYNSAVGPGAGTSEPDRDGRSALIANYIYTTSPPSPPVNPNKGWAPGDTLFVATTRYRGRRLQGAAQVQMQP